MNFLSKIALGIAVVWGSLFNHSTPDTSLQGPQSTLGAFNPTGGGTYYLNTSIGTSATTITLSSFKEPVSNIPYTMTYLNTSILYGTLDPQNPTRSEFISFTGITQNSNGSAILTGVTRGLGRSYPFTASTTLAQAHSGQSIFVLSDTPQFYGQYAVKQNDEVITGHWTVPTPTAAGNPVTKAYADNLSFSGVATATESSAGFSELATKLEQASSTILGSTGAGVVLQARYATSTYNSSGSLQVVVTQNNNKIDDNFISTSTLLVTNTVIASSSMQVYAATSTTNDGVFTYTKPAFLKYIVVEAVGGGGSAGKTSGGPPTAAAGGGAGYVKSIIPAASLASTVTVTAGKGGLAPTSGNADGIAGSNSTFGSFVTANGGGAGQGASGTTGGGGGSGTGDLVLPGSPGDSALAGSSAGNSGGNSRLGVGGRGTAIAGTAFNGSSYGGGGGAGAAGNAGGSGAPGIVIVTQYFY